MHNIGIASHALEDQWCYICKKNNCISITTAARCPQSDGHRTADYEILGPNTSIRVFNLDYFVNFVWAEEQDPNNF